MSHVGTFRTIGDVRFEAAKRRTADMDQAALGEPRFYEYPHWLVRVERALWVLVQRSVLQNGG